MYQETFQTRDMTLAATLMCYDHEVKIEAVDRMGRGQFQFIENDDLSKRIDLWMIGSDNLKVDPKQYSANIRKLKGMIDEFEQR